MPKIKQNPEDKTELPDGYDDENEFLLEMRNRFATAMEVDYDNRSAALEDSEFVAGEQWDDTAKSKRLADKRPALTVNRLPAFVAQVIGNRRMNETSIKVDADVGGYKDVAKIRQGLIRSIEKASRADRAYNGAFQNSVICGIGNFECDIDYAHDDVFELDAKIGQIPNPLAVLYDPQHREPTGADCRYVFIIDSLSKEEFKAEYGDIAVGSSSGLGFDQATDPMLTADGWVTQDQVRVVAYWMMTYEDRTVALFPDGDVRDVTDMEEEDYIDLVVTDNDGEPYVRETKRSYAHKYICTGTQILDGPFTLPIKRIPVFRVPGWEIDVGFTRHRFGLVRFAKDPARMHNYWRSVIVEKLMMTPRAPWIAPDTAVQGRENQWRNAHLSNDTLLVYNGDSGIAPTRTDPAQIEPALIQESGMAMQDIKDVTNLHEASLGIQGNEVSGKALIARQRMGELGTVIYQDNLDMAIEECGKVLNDLIPIVYDTARSVKIIGFDDEDEQAEKIQLINDETSPDSIDITVGKYSVTTVTGPSYTTRRLEAQEGMWNLINAMPETAAVSADLIVEAQDWPNSGKIAKRLRRRAIAEGFAEPNEDDITPQMREQQAQQAQLQQLQMQMQLEDAKLELAKKRADVAETEARTLEAQARARAALMKAQTDGRKVDIDERRLDIDEQAADTNTARTLADIDQMDTENERTWIDMAIRTAQGDRQTRGTENA